MEYRQEAIYTLNEAMKNNEAIFDIGIINLMDKKDNLNIYDKEYEVGYGDFVLGVLEDKKLLGQSTLKEKWVQKIIEDNLSYYIGKIHISYINQNRTIPIAVPIKQNDELIGILAVTLKLDYFSTHYSKLMINKNDIVTVIDSDKNILFHPGGEKIINSTAPEVKQIVNNTVSGKKYFISTFDGVKKHYFVSDKFSLQNMENDWYVMYGIPNKFITYQIRKLLISLTQAYFIMFLILNTSYYFVFRNLVVKPLTEITNSLQVMSSKEADLTQKLTLNKKDEFNLIVKYYNEFVDTIANLINNIKNNFTTVNQICEQVSAAMEQTTKTVQVQNEQLTYIASSVEEINQNGKEINDIVEQDVEILGKAKEDNNKGIANLNKIQTNIKTIQNNYDNLTLRIHNYSNIIKEINPILNLINDVAENTHLLALNASIEAARIGQEGAGFTVIAGEIGKLSEKTRNSIKEITTTLNEIVSQNKEVNEQIEIVDNSISDSQENIINTTNIFNTIMNNMETIFNNFINKIKPAIYQQSEALENSSSSIQEISSAFAETRSIIETVGDEMENLSNLNNKLQELINRFKL